MNTSSSYVLSSVIGPDMATNITSFIPNPENESREMRDGFLFEHLDVCYDSYKDKEMEEIARIQKQMSGRNYDYETVLELREQIQDIHYEIDSISYWDLMKKYPRVSLKTMSPTSRSNPLYFTLR